MNRRKLTDTTVLSSKQYEILNIMLQLLLLINLAIIFIGNVNAEPKQMREKNTIPPPSKVSQRQLGIGGTLNIMGYGPSLGGLASANAKYWLSNVTAFACEIDFPLFDEFGFNADYLFHLKTRHFDSSWLPYVGIGMLIYHSVDIQVNTHSSSPDGSSVITSSSLSSWKIGLRAPIGIEMPFSNKDFSVFVQLAPGLRNVPNASSINESSANVSFAIRLDLGARYYF